MTTNNYSSKRTVLAVPGSNSRMIEKARTLDADEIFLDLEDSVAISEKTSARTQVIAELTKSGFKSQTVSVRVNEQTQAIGVEDINQIVSQIPLKFDSLIIPKVESAEQVLNLSQRLSQIEESCGIKKGKIKLQLQIESARGLVNVTKIASASDRIVALIFGPGDFAASMGMQVLNIGENPLNFPGEDAYHYPLMSILVAARSNNLLAIDGPYSDIKNEIGLRQRANLSASLGYDGKWVIHPSQIDIVNSIFTPSQKYFDNANRIIKHFEYSSESEGARGAYLFEGKMIDEATRKMAAVVFAKGIAAGLKPTRNGEIDD